MRFPSNNKKSKDKIIPSNSIYIRPSLNQTVTISSAKNKPIKPYVSKTNYASMADNISLYKNQTASQSGQSLFEANNGGLGMNENVGLDRSNRLNGISVLDRNGLDRNKLDRNNGLDRNGQDRNNRLDRNLLDKNGLDRNDALKKQDLINRNPNSPRHGYYNKIPSNNLQTNRPAATNHSNGPSNNQSLHHPIKYPPISKERQYGQTDSQTLSSDEFNFHTTTIGKRTDQIIKFKNKREGEFDDGYVDIDDEDDEDKDKHKSDGISSRRKRDHPNRSNNLPRNQGDNVSNMSNNYNRHDNNALISNLYTSSIGSNRLLNHTKTSNVYNFNRRKYQPMLNNSTSLPNIDGIHNNKIDARDSIDINFGLNIDLIREEALIESNDPFEIQNHNIKDRNRNNARSSHKRGNGNQNSPSRRKGSQSRKKKRQETDQDRRDNDHHGLAITKTPHTNRFRSKGNNQDYSIQNLRSDSYDSQINRQGSFNMLLGQRGNMNELLGQRVNINQSYTRRNFFDDPRIIELNTQQILETVRSIINQDDVFVSGKSQKIKRQPIIHQYTQKVEVQKDAHTHSGKGNSQLGDDPKSQESWLSENLSKLSLKSKQDSQLSKGQITGNEDRFENYSGNDNATPKSIQKNQSQDSQGNQRRVQSLQSNIENNVKLPNKAKTINKAKSEMQNNQRPQSVDRKPNKNNQKNKKQNKKIKQLRSQNDPTKTNSNRINAHINSVSHNREMPDNREIPQNREAPSPQDFPRTNRSLRSQRSTIQVMKLNPKSTNKKSRAMTHLLKQVSKKAIVTDLSNTIHQTNQSDRESRIVTQSIRNIRNLTSLRNINQPRQQTQFVLGRNEDLKAKIARSLYGNNMQRYEKYQIVILSQKKWSNAQNQQSQFNSLDGIHQSDGQTSNNNAPNNLNQPLRNQSRYPRRIRLAPKKYWLGQCNIYHYGILIAEVKLKSRIKREKSILQNMKATVETSSSVAGNQVNREKPKKENNIERTKKQNKPPIKKKIIQKNKSILRSNNSRRGKRIQASHKKKVVWK